MNTNFLDIFIIAVLIICIIMLATGNGDTLTRLFGGGKNLEDNYDIQKVHRASLVFCLVLLASELLTFFLGAKYPVLGLVTVGVAIISLGVYAMYMRKYAKK